MLRFFNCPECNAPAFVANDTPESGRVYCEECNTAFSVASDTHPFEWSGIEPEQA